MHSTIYRLTFGYGHATWEWEPCIALRSHLHPLVIAALYRILAALSLDRPFLIA